MLNVMSVIIISSIYLSIICLALYVKVQEMPRFFRDMPKKSDWFTMKKVKLNVYYNYSDMRSIKVVEKKSYGPIIIHYLRIRMLALKMDKYPLDIEGEFGVSWNISKA